MPRPTEATQTPDFVAPINLAGSFSSLQKVAINKTLRTMAGKNVVQADVTASSGSTGTTFTDVPGMTWNLVKGGKYRINGSLITAANAAGGVKVALTATGVTSLPVIVTEGVQAAALTAQRVTAFGSIFAATADVMRVEIDGYIEPNARGKLTLQFAQNASNAAASTLYKGSWVQVLKVG